MGGGDSPPSTNYACTRRLFRIDDTNSRINLSPETIAKIFFSAPIIGRVSTMTNVSTGYCREYHPGNESFGGFLSFFFLMDNSGKS